MRTLIFLCIVCVLASAFASPVPEEEEIDKRFLGSIGRKIKHTVQKIVHQVKKTVEHLKEGVVQLVDGVSHGAKKIGELVTKEGKHFGTLFVNSAAGQAIIQIGGKAYQLNKGLYEQAKREFEKQVKNVKFEDVLYKVFPILKADAGDCKQALNLVLTAEGAGAIAKAGDPLITKFCRFREHVVNVFKEKVTHG